MAVFETFTLLFKADSGQLKKEVDDVKKKTNENTDTFKKAEDQTKKTDNEFIHLAGTLAKVAAAYFSVGAVIGGFRSSLSHTTELAQFSRETGVNIEKLDAWGKAIKNAGGDANAFYSDVTSLAKKFNSSESSALQFLAKDAASVFQRLGRTQAQIYGQEQLGLSASTISFLLQGQKAVDAALARQYKLGVVNEKDAEISRNFNKSTGELADAFDKLYRSVAVDLLPKLTDFADALTKVVSFFTYFREDPKNLDPKEYLKPNNLFNPKFYEQFKNKENPDLNAPYEQFKNKENPDLNAPAVNTSYHIPTSISSISNSQARSLHVGDVTINTTAQDGKRMGDEFISQIDQKSQYMQSNSYFDNAVVI